MNEKVKLLVLIENLELECKYYDGELPDCARAEIKYHYPRCGGRIKNCNLPQGFIKELRDEQD